MSAPNDDLADFLQSTGLFDGVDRATLHELEPELTNVTLPDGGVLVREGNPDRNLYIVRSGRLRVSGRTPARREPRVLFNVRRGETAGEMGLLSDDRASTTVDAAGPATVLVLSKSGFDRFAAAHPEAAHHVLQSLGRRLETHRLAVALQLGPFGFRHALGRVTGKKTDDASR